MKIEWGNAAQWASAIAAVVVAGLAIYGVFFSATSQALVSFLQSELAVRNMRIAVLERRERDLQVSINAAQSNLNGLSEQKAELEKQVATLRAEQDKFSKRVQELGAALSGTEFSLAREKLSARIASGFSALTVHRINIVSDWLRPEGVRAESVRPWDSYLDHLKRSVEELPSGSGPRANRHRQIHAAMQPLHFARDSSSGNAHSAK
jgi:chaperonin cofactor prefoldin